jgi:prolipoprotein diacylglyceryl transferase
MDPYLYLASIPSPAQGVWHLGPLPLRAYALCIIAGIVAAIVIGERRWIARGGSAGTTGDIAVWAVPFGIVGGRIYHVITTPGPYFGEGGDPVAALQIWQGGLGIWGAVILGGVGAWIACRRRGIPLPAFADAIAPAILVAQAIGRLGNYFNQELFGRPTDVPWALEIDAEHRPLGFENVAAFHPTFLYELLWNLALAALVVWADRRFRLGHGRVFALYVAGYCVGRVWIEALRIDEAERILGLRLNIFTCIVFFVGAVVYFVLSARARPGREDVVEPLRSPPAGTGGDPADGTAGDDGAAPRDGGAALDTDPSSAHPPGAEPGRATLG